MKRIIWNLKQLFPLTYVSVYRTGDGRFVSIFRMWMGKVFSHQRLTVVDG